MKKIKLIDIDGKMPEEVSQEILVGMTRKKEEDNTNHAFSAEMLISSL